MPKAPYWMLEGAWYIYVLIMSPVALYEAFIDDGFAGLMIGFFAMGFCLLIPQILKGNGQ
jgi:hypothetical protein